jgi:hypothetical protein
METKTTNEINCLRNQKDVKWVKVNDKFEEEIYTIIAEIISRYGFDDKTENAIKYFQKRFNELSQSNPKRDSQGIDKLSNPDKESLNNSSKSGNDTLTEDEEFRKYFKRLS